LVNDPSLAQKFSTNPTDFSALGVDPFYGLFMMLFPFIAGLAAFVLLVRPLHQRPFRSTISSTGKFRWNHFLISFLIWIVLSVIYLFAYMKVEPENFTLSNTSVSLIYISLIAIAMIPFQAGLEEFIFRGYLMQGFAPVLGYRWFPLIMTSLLFALLHAMNPEVKEYGFFTMMPQYIVFGLIFGIVTIMDDGIEAAIGAHAANNIFLVIMLTHESSAIPTPALYEQKVIYPWTEFTGLVISGIVFIMLMNGIFGWKAPKSPKGDFEARPLGGQG